MKKFESIGFIGGGRVTRFLLEGWQLAGRLPDNMRVADCNADVLAALLRDFPAITAVSTPEAAECDLVIWDRPTCGSSGRPCGNWRNPSGSVRRKPTPRC
jgi:hypothetical protein